MAGWSRATEVHMGKSAPGFSFVELSAVVLLFSGIQTTAAAEEAARAVYIANMGVMIERGDTKIVFDPLFRYDYDTYQRVPTELEVALVNGAEPWDGIDAVFISHHHGDHFDPAMVLELLRNQSGADLFGPQQAADAIRELVPDPKDPLLDRIHGLSLENGTAAEDITVGPLLVEAVRIRHAGWPNRHAHVENLVFRVTLDDATTVMHFGDADVDDAHFAITPEHWEERHSHLALPPYWFLASDRGRQVLEERVDAGKVIGMHVPADMAEIPELRGERLREVDLFTKPGESREIQE